MRIKLFSNYLPLLCLTACVWVSCSQNREKKSGKKDHTPVMRLTTTTIEVPQSYVADVQAVQFVEVKPINPAKRNVMVVKNEMRLLKQKRNVLQI